jgi:hypothetical protein
MEQVIRRKVEWKSASWCFNGEIAKIKLQDRVWFPMFAIPNNTSGYEG